MKLCIYGMGGLGKEVFDIALRANKVNSYWDEIFFIVDDLDSQKETYEGSVNSVNFIFNNFDLNDIELIIAVGEPKVRKLLYDKVKAKNAKIATLIDPSAVVSKTATISEGAIIAPLSIIASSAFIGCNVAVNTHSTIGHDIKINKHSVISSHVTLGGASIIGEESFIGLGSQIKEKTKIGNKVIIGMGSIVFTNVPDNVIAIGNPARVSRQNDNNLVFR